MYFDKMDYKSDINSLIGYLDQHIKMGGDLDNEKIKIILIILIKELKLLKEKVFLGNA